MIAPRVAQAAPGSRVEWALSSPSDPGRLAVFVLAQSPGWTPVDRRFLPVAADALFFASLQPQALGGLLAPAQVVLDGQGRTAPGQGPALAIPALPALSGQSFSVCFATLDPSAASALGTISHAATLRVL